MTSSKSLPGITERPHADLVLYDGHCVFCTNSVDFLMRFDLGKRLAAVSIHDPLVAQQFGDLSYDQLMEQMYVIPASDRKLRYGGAAAIRYLSRKLPLLWPLAPFLHLPYSLPVWQFLYRQIAARRYRIANRNQDACDSGSCEFHFQKHKGNNR